MKRLVMLIVFLWAFPACAVDPLWYYLKAPIPDCSNVTNSKLLFNPATPEFTCGTDQGSAGSGDVEAVWGCTSGDCSTLTAAAGDTLDAGSADSSKPCGRGTSLPGTCAEGACFQDTDSGGGELYICTATNTWTKLDADTGGITSMGDCTSGDCFVDGTNNGTVIIYEGSTVDTYENRLTFTGQPTADTTVTIPNETGTLCTTGSVCTGYVGTTRTLTGGAGVDIGGSDSAQDLSANRSFAVDTKEIGTNIWGTGSGIAWTFDVGATNPVLTFASNSLQLTGAATLGTTASAVTIGSGAASTLTFNASGGTDPLFTAGDNTLALTGKLGLGMTPTLPLDVTGQVSVSGTLTPAANAEGLYANYIINPSAGSTTGRAVVVVGQKTNSTAMNEYAGLDVSLQPAGSGALTTLANRVKSINYSSNTTTDNFGLWLKSGASSGATNSHDYTLYLAAPQATGTLTSAWALYSASTQPSYFTGSVAIGNDPVPALNSLVQVTDEFTATTDATAIKANVTFTPGATWRTERGFYLGLDTGNSTALTAVQGMVMDVRPTGGGDATMQSGIDVYSYPTGGTTTDNYGLRITSGAGSGATVTRDYGVYIAAPTATGTITDGWAIYSASTKPSYFTGSLAANATSGTAADFIATSGTAVNGAASTGSAAGFIRSSVAGAAVPVVGIDATHNSDPGPALKISHLGTGRAIDVGGGDVYFADALTIGGGGPSAASLDVTGIARLTPTDSPGHTCAADLEGSLYYDTSRHEVCACRYTGSVYNWCLMSAPATCGSTTNCG